MLSTHSYNKGNQAVREATQYASVPSKLTISSHLFASFGMLAI